MPLDPPPDAVGLARFTVGEWLIDPRACQASRGETTEKLRPQLTDLLVCLARRPGKIVLKSEILADVWPGQFIADSGLSRCVAELRQVFGDDAHQPRYLETIPKRGYRLIAPVTWLGEATPSAPARDAAVPAVEVPARTETLPGRRTRLWTAVSVVALGAAVAGGVFLSTRSSAKVLTDRDTVLLADVRNSTGDRVFDDALRLALAVNLEQAPFLKFLPQEAVRAALLRSGRPLDEPVVGPVALDVCRREGAAVLLAGSIAPLGSRYAVGLEAIACENGESVGTALEEASTRERVLPALERVATRIRERLGESRESLRLHGVPLVQATTKSLDALKALTLGDVHRDAGRHEEALPYYRQATDLDPEFALGWARRGVTARNIGVRAEAIPAIRRAFALVDRVSQPERFFIEALYYRLVEGNPQKAIESHRAWRAMYPGSVTPANAIASTLADELGDYEGAIAEAREAIRLAPSAAMPYNNLVQSLVATGRFADARKAVIEAASRGVDDWANHLWLWLAAESEGDQAGMEREYQWARRPGSQPLAFMQVRAQVLAGRGRLAEARRAWDEALAEAARTGARPAALHADLATAEAMIGDRAAARTAVEAAMSAGPEPITLTVAAAAAALIGDVARARSIVDQARRAAEEDPGLLKVLLPSTEALIKLREGRGEEALRILQPLTPYERGSSFTLTPLLFRGMACSAAGRAAEAADAFGELLRLRATAPGPWLAAAAISRARALRDAGESQRSLAAYETFLELWRDADPLPLLKAAQQERDAVAATAAAAGAR